MRGRPRPDIHLRHLWPASGRSDRLGWLADPHWIADPHNTRPGDQAAQSQAERISFPLRDALKHQPGLAEARLTHAHHHATLQYAVEDRLHTVIPGPDADDAAKPGFLRERLTGGNHQICPEPPRINLDLRQLGLHPGHGSRADYAERHLIEMADGALLAHLYLRQPGQRAEELVRRAGADRIDAAVRPDHNRRLDVTSGRL